MRNMDRDMPLLPSRTPRPAPKAARSSHASTASGRRRPRGGWPRLPRAGPFSLEPSPPTPASPALKILLAGIDKDERRAVEATVRQALGARASSGPWSISVVNFGGRWSVTLEGPGDRSRGLSFVTDSSRLAEAVRQALGDEGAASPDSGAAPEGPARPSTEARDPHVCESCRQAVTVVYELQAGEPRTLVPLACPHCWKIGHVEIGAWAAAGGDYRSEKA